MEDFGLSLLRTLDSLYEEIMVLKRHMADQQSEFLQASIMDGLCQATPKQRIAFIEKSELKSDPSSFFLIDFAALSMAKKMQLALLISDILQQ